MNERSVPSASALFEHLEPRTFLTGGPPYAFVTAGLSFDQNPDHTPTMFWGTGTVGLNDSFSGTFERFDNHSRSGSLPLPWSGFTRPDNDRMRLVSAPGVAPYATQDAGQFIAQQGFPASSFTGREADGSVRDMGYFVTPYNLGDTVGTTHVITPRSYLKLDYVLTSFAALTAKGFELVTLMIVPENYTVGGVSTARFTFKYMFKAGTIETPGVSLLSETATSLSFGNGVQLYSTFHRSTNFLVVDPNPQDGVVGFGMGLARFRNGGDSIKNDMIPGTFRGSVVTSGAQSAAFFGVSPPPTGPGAAGITSVVITLAAGGQYTMYRAAQFDQGLRVPISTGTWNYGPNPSDEVLDRGRLQLVGPAGRTAIFRPARFAAGMLLPESVSAPGASTERIIGLLTLGNYTPFAPGLDYQEGVVDVDASGHPIAYQHATSTDPELVSWYSVDLLIVGGGQPVAGPLFTWHDLTFTRFGVVGRAAATGNLQLWERTDDQWIYTDLTAKLAGSKAFGGDIAGSVYGMFGDPYRSPRAAIVGVDTSGKFIAYIEGNGWSFVDVEAQGLLGQGVHPKLVGPLAGFGTPWNAFNFAGVDDKGQIWSLWRSAALPGTQWAINNLSAIAGNVPKMVSHLTAVTTPWNAFHITGLDSAGRVIITWWEKSVGWRYDGLTELTHGPALVGLEISTNYNTTQGVINISGFDSDGSVIMYWWNPAAGWNVARPVTALSLPQRASGPIALDGFVVPYTTIPGLIDSFQTLTWKNNIGHRMRLAWQTATPAVWLLQDLTDLAVPK